MLGQSKWLQLGKGEAQMNDVPRWEVQIRAGVGYDTTKGTTQRGCLIEPLRHISSGFLPKRIKRNYTNIP